MKTHTPVRCPYCDGAMVPVALRCDACEVEVAGHFATNEFASLAEDDLHLLRIFVMYEGRIRDMESALGVSYPTIKTRLARLKETLASKRPAPETTPAAMPGAEQFTAAVLKDLEAGRVTFDQAMARIRQIQAG